MFSIFKKVAPVSTSATDILTFAIGDVHGRSDLLDKLLAQIRRDHIPSNVKPQLVFLGDYVDRGPDSRGVLERIIELQCTRWCNVEALRGNHEQTMYNFVMERKCGPAWLANGGVNTFQSYGVAPPPIAADDDVWAEAQNALLLAIGRTHFEFLASLRSYYIQDDYLFVHAGVLPGVPIAQQTDESLLWIRDPFLTAAKPSERVVVHGHTPTASPEDKLWRINVDTGAYASGVLSAVKLLGTSREFISVN